MFLAAMLLLAFGTARAQVNDPKPVDPKTDSIMKSRMAEMSQLQEQFAEWMRELGMGLQYLSDSIDWKAYEKEMEQWGKEFGKDMEEWGRKMEQWGEQYEKNFNYPFGESLRKKGKPEVKSVKLCGSGNVRIRQVTEGFSLTRKNELVSDYEMADGAVVLMGSDDYQVAVRQLESVYVTGSGDVIGQGTMTGGNLAIWGHSSGDVRMSVDYDTIRVKMTGSGDVALSGHCKVLYADMYGSGDLRTQSLQCDDLNVSVYGSGRVVTGDSSYSNSWKPKQRERGLLLYPHWQGFEAGLNMLFNTAVDVVNSNNGAQGMDLRPLRSWYFGFNIADVGIAFNKRHTAGLFTGVGIGWNNFSWNNDVTIEYDPDNVVYTLVPIDSDKVVKNSKNGALFLQVPLMLEFRPTRQMYIEAGVTGGLRFAQWYRVKFADGTIDKHYYGSDHLNLFKLDASLRVGGYDMGFFANYALLPLFDMGNAKIHPISFGFSVNF